MELHAADLDEDANAEFKYSFSNYASQSERDLFNLDAESGEIRVKCLLDFEKSDVYELVLQAVDSASNAGYSNVLVTIVDVNDNAPEIKLTLVIKMVPEDPAPGTLIAVFSITDGDSGENGQIRCHIPMNVPFKLQSTVMNNYMIVTTDILDRESTALYNLPISAWDAGLPALSNNKTIASEQPPLQDISCGILHSSVLGCLRFLVYINDQDLFIGGMIKKFADDTKIGCVVGNDEESCGLQEDMHLTIKTYRSKLIMGGAYKVNSVGNSKVKFQCSLESHDVPLEDLAISKKRFMRGEWFNPGKEMSHSARLLLLRKRAIPSMFLLCAWNLVSGHIRYSIPEELKHGAFVGRIAKDLGLPLEELLIRKFRIVSESPKHYLDATSKSGLLIVRERIDREQLCAQSVKCVLTLEVVIENPVEQYRVDVDIEDINDNSPSFPHGETRLEIAESTIPGTRFLLENAHDPDVGTNSIREYKLSPNEKFSLDVQHRGEWQLVHLVLEKSLDREEDSSHQLLLRAIDGGTPQQSGITEITITVLDSNDNAPVFQQTLYTVILKEDAPPGAMVIQLNATDLDYGSNSEILYSFNSYNKAWLREVFSIDPKSGAISIKGILDFEKASVYEINVEAKDSGYPSYTAHCTVRVNITDVNDNAPALTLNSVSSKISEDAQIGTLIALISVTDRDSHENEQTDCQIYPNLPFELKSSIRNSYRLVTKELLDRESTAEYDISVMCSDRGSPPLSSNKTIVVHLTDINDNAPIFLRSSYIIYAMENKPPGSSIGSVIALDPDEDQNSQLSYDILESLIEGLPVTSYVSMNSENGIIFSQRSFDYEQIKRFTVQIQARDAGFPPLSSNVTVNVIILDQNDNAPVIISTRPANRNTIKVPRSADPGYLVTKLTASDADSGQNARISYQLMQATDRSLFSVSHSSGEVRTIRRLKDHHVTVQRLVIQVKDNGHPALSVTATVTVTISEQSAEINHDSVETRRDVNYSSNLAFYIIIALAVISFILLLVIIALVIAICPSDRSSTYDPTCFASSCCCKSSLNATERSQHSNVNLQVVPDSKLITNVLEVRGNGSLSDSYRYNVRSAPEPSKMEFMFLASSNASTPGTIRKITRTYVSEQCSKPTNIWNGISSEIEKNNDSLQRNCVFSTVQEQNIAVPSSDLNDKPLRVLQTSYTDYVMENNAPQHL
uniref:protocadherin gamma-B5-like n=1 Tax=Pristiophorus japonicus TaxID=55135 RepID=UPI00398F8414